MTNHNFTSKKATKILFPLILLFCGHFVFAQTPTVQDCLGAIPICAQTYTETTSPSVLEIIPMKSMELLREEFAAWIMS